MLHLLGRGIMPEWNEEKHDRDEVFAFLCYRGTHYAKTVYIDFCMEGPSWFLVILEKMILKLIPNTHPMLHERVKPCSKDLDRHEMSSILKENMMYYEGIGLSANQIGICERVFIMMLNIETEKTITCFNPRIIKRYDDNVW